MWEYICCFSADSDSDTTSIWADSIEEAEDKFVEKYAYHLNLIIPVPRDFTYLENR